MNSSRFRIAHSGGSLLSARRCAAALLHSSEIVKYFSMIPVGIIGLPLSRRKVKHY